MVIKVKAKNHCKVKIIPVTVLICITKRAVGLQPNTFLFCYYLLLGIWFLSPHAPLFFRSVNIVTIALLAACLLKERLTVPKITGAILSVVGVILVVQPWYDHSSSDDETVSTDTKIQNKDSRDFLLPFYHHGYNYGNLQNLNGSNVTTVQPRDPEEDNIDNIIGYILATVAGVFSSFANIVLKFRLQKVPASTLNVYSGALGMIASLVMSFAMEEDLAFPTDALNIFYVAAQVNGSNNGSILRYSRFLEINFF